MPAIKNSTFWSTLMLFVSVLVVLAMTTIMFGYFDERFMFREASGYLRTAAQISVFVLGLCTLIALLSWKNKASLIKALIAIAIVLTPLMVLKNNMPAGTALFATAPAVPALTHICLLDIAQDYHWYLTGALLLPCLVSKADLSD